MQKLMEGYQKLDLQQAVLLTLACILAYEQVKGSSHTGCSLHLPLAKALHGRQVFLTLQRHTMCC